MTLTLTMLILLMLYTCNNGAFYNSVSILRIAELKDVRESVDQITKAKARTEPAKRSQEFLEHLRFSL